MSKSYVNESKTSSLEIKFMQQLEHKLHQNQLLQISIALWVARTHFRQKTTSTCDKRNYLYTKIDLISLEIEMYRLLYPCFGDVTLVAILLPCTLLARFYRYRFYCTVFLKRSSIQN